MDLSSFKPRQPLSTAELLHSAFEYLPPALQREIYKTFYIGFSTLFDAIAHVLRALIFKHPTTLKFYSRFIFSPFFFAKFMGYPIFFSRPMAGLTNQDPVRDSRAGAPLLTPRICKVLTVRGTRRRTLENFLYQWPPP